MKIAYKYLVVLTGLDIILDVVCAQENVQANTDIHPVVG